MKLTFATGLAHLALSILGAGVAFSQSTLIQTQTFGPTDLLLPTYTEPQSVIDTVSGNLSFLHFDPELGDLRAVRVSFEATSDLSYFGLINNLNPGSFSGVNGNVVKRLRVSPAGAPQLSRQIAFNQTVTVSGMGSNTPATIAYPRRSTSSTVSEVALTSVAAYVGTGTRPIPYTWEIEQSLFASNGTCTGLFTSLGFEVTVTVEYDYDLGSEICAGQPNSTGAAAELGSAGSRTVQDGDFTLSARSLPPAATTLFLVSPVEGFIAGVGGSLGDLCLGGSIGRFVEPGQVQSASGAGVADLAVDLQSIPRAGTLGSVSAGETWYFQAWYRDIDTGGNPTSNLTSALEVAFD